MSIEENKTLIANWIRAFNERDWDAERACRAPEYFTQLSGVPVQLDGAGWEAFLLAFAGGFPDAQIAIESTVGERDIVVLRWTITGTHRGEFQGIPPSGRQVTIAGLELNRIVDGKITEHWGQFDLVGALQQIGAFPVAA